MYCKGCGFQKPGTSELCPRCGEKLTGTAQLTAASPRKIRFHVLILASGLALLAFYLVPRLLIRSELQFAGPTAKLRFLRALERSQYKRVGQKEFRLHDQTLVVIWDLRWTTLSDGKQKEIAGIVGKAWHAVGGQDTIFRVEGSDGAVATWHDNVVELSVPASF